MGRKTLEQCGEEMRELTKRGKISMPVLTTKRDCRSRTSVGPGTCSLARASLVSPRRKGTPSHCARVMLFHQILRLYPSKSLQATATGPILSDRRARLICDTVYWYYTPVMLFKTRSPKLIRQLPGIYLIDLKSRTGKDLSRSRAADDSCFA